MHPSLWISKTGMHAQDKQLSVVANNLANVATVGFKRDRAEFEDLFYQIQRQPGAQSTQDNQIPSGLQIGTGVRVVSTQKVFSTTGFQTTEQPLDVAINGRGFFQILLPDGTIAYSRNGQFHLNSDGDVVNGNGLPLEPGITVPRDATNFTVGEDGTVTIQTPGNVQPQQLGQITLVDFVNPGGLQAMGSNLFLATGASGDPVEGTPGQDGLGFLKQYTLESSNVSVVEEMVNMITTQRAYEMNSKVIATADQMLQFVNQNV
ncbi:flagellar basal-body rod protein FlgG [Spartinivicinus poritis]|uniref:Flagellar basal-body rod protein FlgG n=1 Tax=Spartinivicinus poritis TaxID=2994640 RepID=A0ABT5UAU9_9GAMM|nr:flagellar basal-body rod protein FlgG [Spartinivicinus sp. A2-2]MDE1463508.1 flagellar basal-body rod protein FlgG [Spartinivicinus sp. A2-2]